LFSWRKKKLRVDVGDLMDEKDSLASYLRLALKVEVACDARSVLVCSEDLSLEDLKKLVNKFVYHQHLNNKYWVALESGVVRISKFKEATKKKPSKEALPPSTIKHGW